MSRPNISAMYDSEDMIVAVSSVADGPRAIVRLSGPLSIATCMEVFTPSHRQDGKGVATEAPQQARGAVVAAGHFTVDNDLSVPGYLYVFRSPNSYTGQDVAEMHLLTNRAVLEAMLDQLSDRGLRAAEPGEFTARAYLNGKLDLSQAEAVNEIIAGSNDCQLAAAQQLLGGRLSAEICEIRSGLLELLSLIEAGLDFSEEQIEFITRDEAIRRARAMARRLERLLAGGIRCESLIDMPSVGIAGIPNAGKSSLLNALLGRRRSIVSVEQKTTRDVLSEVLSLPHGDCVLFDCAGLLLEPVDILDNLAQQAALEALRHARLVLFCVDATESMAGSMKLDRQRLREKEVWSMISKAGVTNVIMVATKVDAVDVSARQDRFTQLQTCFGREFAATSSVTGEGLDDLRRTVDERLLEGCHRIASARPSATALSDGFGGAIGLTLRHREAVQGARGDVNQVVDCLGSREDEVAAMLLRGACAGLAGIERPGAGQVDEEVLSAIFGRFCIGK